MTCNVTQELKIFLLLCYIAHARLFVDTSGHNAMLYMCSVNQPLDISSDSLQTFINRVSRYFSSQEISGDVRLSVTNLN